MMILLGEINTQLSERGLYIQQGAVSIVDASVIEANRCRPHSNRKSHTTQDPEGSWNVMFGADGKCKQTYGFKAHLNVDEGGFIQALDYTTGKIHDSRCLIGLLSGRKSAVYADKAYSNNKQHNEWLARHHIENRMIKRARRNKPLTDADHRQHRIYQSVRYTVERIFGVLKLHYGMAKARYVGIARNRTRLELMCIAHNLKRGVSIQKDSFV